MLNFLCAYLVRRLVGDSSRIVVVLEGGVIEPNEYVRTINVRPWFGVS